MAHTSAQPMMRALYTASRPPRNEESVRPRRVIGSILAPRPRARRAWTFAAATINTLMSPAPSAILLQEGHAGHGGVADLRGGAIAPPKPPESIQCRLVSPRSSMNRGGRREGPRGRARHREIIRSHGQPGATGASRRLIRLLNSHRSVFRAPGIRPIEGEMTCKRPYNALCAACLPPPRSP